MLFPIQRAPEKLVDCLRLIAPRPVRDRQMKSHIQQDTGKWLRFSKW
jgi:hypothetical protein